MNDQEQTQISNEAISEVDAACKLEGFNFFDQPHFIQKMIVAGFTAGAIYGARKMRGVYK